PGGPRGAAQVAVVARLYAGLADDLSGLVPLALQRLQLARGDLPHVAEQVGGERLVRVLAQGSGSGPDAGELDAPLGEVVDLICVDAALDDDRRQRVARVLADLPLDLT